MNIFTDIQSEIDSFFTGLNWTFIFMYVIILYGIRHRDEFLWFNRIINHNKHIKPFKVWIAGFIVGGFFVFFSWKENGVMNSQYFSQLLRSWVLVLVFNSVFDKKIIKIENKIIDKD